MNKENKLLYLEGIRGLAALMVVVHHYLLAFYPTHASGDPVNAHFGALEMWYYGSPFIFMTNGLFFVFIFFILSGFVLSRSYFLDKNNDYLVSAVIRRFPRLYIPVAFALIVAFLVLKLSLNFNVEASTITRSIWMESLQGDPSFSHFFADLIYKSMLFGDNSYITVLWTISKELHGSFLVFITLFVFLRIRNSFAVFACLFLILCVAGKYEYSAFILGIILNYSVNIQWNSVMFKRILLGLLIISGLFLGGFPHIYYLSTPVIDGTFYDFLSNTSIIKAGPVFNIFGAFLVIFAVQNSAILQRFFTGKLFSFLGMISFSMYLIHIIVLQSFSSFLFLQLYSVWGYNAGFLVMFAISLLFIFVASYFMAIYIDKNSIVVAKAIYKKYLSYRPIGGRTVQKL